MAESHEKMELVDIQLVDDEYVYVGKCPACGASFGWCKFQLSIYADDPKKCPHCGAAFYAKIAVTIYKVVKQDG